MVNLYTIQDLWQELIAWFNEIVWLDVLLAAGKLIALTIIVIVVHFLVKKILKRILRIKIKLKSVNNEKLEKRNETLNQLIVSILRYVTIPIYVVLALPILGVNPTTVFAGAGIVGLIVTFAFQDLLKDIVAGVFIIFERVYEVDDYISVNGFDGRVIKIGVKTTTIKAWSGEICTVNNRDVADVKNFTVGDSQITVNYFTVSLDTKIEDVYAAFEKDLDLMIANYPQVITKPVIKGINQTTPYGIEFQVNTVVQPETHWQFRRSFNEELVKWCHKNNFKTARLTTKDEQ